MGEQSGHSLLQLRHVSPPPAAGHEIIWYQNSSIFIVKQHFYIPTLQFWCRQTVQSCSQEALCSVKVELQLNNDQNGEQAVFKDLDVSLWFGKSDYVR